MKDNRIVRVIALISFILISIVTSGCASISQVNTEEPKDVVIVAPEKVVDDDANHIYVTTDETKIYPEANTNRTKLGTLDFGISLNVRPVEVTDGYWGWIKEVMGYCRFDTLTHIPLEEVIGIAYVKEDTRAVYYLEPVSEGKAIPVEPYNTFEIDPYIYNKEFYKIGEHAYINKKHIDIDYFSKKYYTEVIKPVLDSGLITRHRIPYKKNVSSVITEPSGLTSDELERVLSETELEGLGDAFSKLDDNGVNAIFAISVAQLESDSGTSRMARQDNNLFGLIGMKFSSKEECINYFGDLMNRLYFSRGRDTVESIQPVYCPDNPYWTSEIFAFMNKNSFKAIRGN